MSKILKHLPSCDDARRYRELEMQARRTAASVEPLFRESFLRAARKWQLLAEDAERQTGLSRRASLAGRNSVVEY